HLVATWQQDRFPVYGGALSNLVAVSHDGGKTWSSHTVGKLSRCTGGAKERASDPWLSFGPDGSLLLSSLVFDNDASGQLSERSDGGRSWNGQRAIYTPPTGFFTDPVLIRVLPDGSLLNLFFLDNGSFALPEGSPTVPWDVMAQRSTDGGQTWGDAVRVATAQPWPPSDPDSGQEVRAIPLISLDAGAD